MSPFHLWVWYVRLQITRFRETLRYFLSSLHAIKREVYYVEHGRYTYLGRWKMDYFNAKIFDDYPFVCGHQLASAKSPNLPNSFFYVVMESSSDFSLLKAAMPHDADIRLISDFR